MPSQVVHKIESPWLTPQEAADYLGIAVGTLRNWTSNGVVPYAKRGGVVRYHREELDHWLRTGVGSPQAAAADSDRINDPEADELADD